MAACADQTTNRLRVLKTGSALMNRRIKARMLRAFRMVFFPLHNYIGDAKAFSGIYFFGGAALRWSKSLSRNVRKPDPLGTSGLTAQVSAGPNTT